MKISIRKSITLLTAGALITSQSFAADVIPGFGAGGTYNPALIAPVVATPVAPVDTTESIAAGTTAEGAGTAGTASTLGISTPVLIGGAVALAAAAAIAIGASSSSGGGSSAPSH